MADEPLSAPELRTLLVTLLAGATDSPAARWEKLVLGINQLPFHTYPQCNWRVRSTGSAAEVDAIERAAAVVRGEHPYVGRGFP